VDIKKKAVEGGDFFYQIQNSPTQRGQKGVAKRTREKRYLVIGGNKEKKEGTHD